MTEETFHGPSVALRASIRRRRTLPIKGEVLVKVGDVVKSDTVVARAEIKGSFHPVPVASILGVSPSELGEVMLVAEGRNISKGEALARRRSMLGLIQTVVESPLDGVVEAVSRVTGQVMLRDKSTRFNLLAYVPGRVADTDGERWVDIDAEVCLVQGVFGVGGESHGPLRRVSDLPGEDMSARDVLPSDRGSVLFTGGQLDLLALKAMEEAGVKGVVAASASGVDLLKWKGGRLNPASTGAEDAPLTVVLTEGFGRLTMTPSTFQVLSRLDGTPVSVSGVTQIRAGVIRPELAAAPLAEDADGSSMLHRPIGVGDTVRIVRGSLFGKTGRIEGIPSDPVSIATGAKSLVYEITLTDGGSYMAPRQNVERLG